MAFDPISQRKPKSLGAKYRIGLVNACVLIANMNIEWMQRDEYDVCMESGQGPMLILAGKSDLFDLNDPGLTGLLELATSNSFEIKRSEIETMFGLPFVVLIYEGKHWDFPIVHNAGSWSVPTEVLSRLSGAENKIAHFEYHAYESTVTIMGHLLNVESWSYLCWLIVTEMESGEKRLMDIIDVPGESSRIVLFKKFLSASSSAPDAMVYEFHDDTKVVKKSLPADEFNRNEVSIRNRNQSLRLLVTESNTSLIENAAESQGWEFSHDESVALVDLEIDGTVIVDLNGTGKTTTKPFEVPNGFTYFSYTWSMEDPEGEIRICSVKEPDSFVDWNSNETSGTSVCYESGKFFFKIFCRGNWRLVVHVDEEAFGVVDDYAEDETDNDIELYESQQEFVMWHMMIDNYIMMTPENVDERFKSIVRQAPGINFIEDLRRGYALNPETTLRVPLNEKQISQIAENVRDLDRLVRSLLPRNEVDYATGAVRFLGQVDVAKANSLQKKIWQARVAIGKALAKARAHNTVYLFATASGGSAPYLIFQCTDGEYQQKVADSNAAWANAAEALDRSQQPRRNAAAWFDEGHRRGYF
jgi:hypothetical protein